jgi:small-conductance mechanosensitive channel
MFASILAANENNENNSNGAAYENGVTVEDNAIVEDNAADEDKNYYGYIEANAEVAPFNETLFTIYGNLGSISAKKRADQVSHNIKKLKDDMFFRQDSLVVFDEDEISNIVYMGNIILGVTEHQAKVLGRQRLELAHEYCQIIYDAVIKRRNLNIWIIVAKQSALSLFVLAAMFLSVKCLNKFLRFFEIYLWRKKESSTQVINNIIDIEKQRKFISYFFKIVRYVLIVVVLYWCFFAFLSIFPATKWIADTLLGYVMMPLKKSLFAVRNYMPNLFAIIVIVSLFKLLSKLLHIVAERIEDGTITIKNLQPDLALPTYRIVRFVLIIFGFIFIFPHLPNSHSEAFKGITVFLGLLLSMGSTSIINNIISGFVITYMRPFNLGDYIKIGEHTGTVMEKTSLVTRMKTIKNEIITIPNSNIMTAAAINYTVSAKDFGLLLTTNVIISYEAPWRTVHELLISAGLKTNAVLKEPTPVVLQTALTDTSIHYELFVYTKDAERMLFTLSEVRQNIQDIFNESGIEILCPTVFEHRNASNSSIPKNYLKEPVRKEFYVKTTSEN